MREHPAYFENRELNKDIYEKERKISGLRTIRILHNPDLSYLFDYYYHRANEVISYLAVLAIPIYLYYNPIYKTIYTPQHAYEYFYFLVPWVCLFYFPYGCGGSKNVALQQYKNSGYTETSYQDSNESNPDSIIEIHLKEAQKASLADFFKAPLFFYLSLSLYALLAVLPIGVYLAIYEPPKIGLSWTTSTAIIQAFPTITGWLKQGLNSLVLFPVWLSLFYVPYRLMELSKYSENVIKTDYDFRREMIETHEVIIQDEMRKKRQHENKEDDAHFMTSQEISAAGLTSGAGIPLGKTLDGKEIHYNGGLHLMTIAPNGSWKHAAVQGNVLIEYDAPIVFIDPKGEGAIVTAKSRRDLLRHEVHILNPFGVLEDDFKAQGFKSSRFNPLAALNPSSKNFTADISALCEALILTEGKEPFFDNSARNLVAALIMYVCTVPDEVATLPRVREILTSDKQLRAVLLDAESSKFKPLQQKAAAFIKDRKAADLGINPSVLDSARTQTSFLDDTCLSDNLSGSDFRFLDLKQKKITVYIVLPAKMVFTYSRWFRLLVTAGLDELMSTPKKGEKTVLFMLDEAPILGHLSSLETAFGLSRGFGVQLWPFFQDINQLRGIYKERANSFFSNSGVHQFFTPNDLETADHIEKRCGEVTHIASGASYGEKVSITESERAKPLYTAHSLLSMPDDRQILFIAKHSNPIKAAKVRYFKNLKYKGRYNKNPYV